MEISMNLAEKVASAVRSCKPLMMQKFSVSEKGSASNLVTTADTAVQERLRALLGKSCRRRGF